MSFVDDPDSSIELNLVEEFGAEEYTDQLLEVYVPNRDRDGNKIGRHADWVREAQELLTAIGRGTSSQDVRGTWVDFSGKVIYEKTVLIYSYVDGERFAQNIRTLRDFLHRFGRETGQGEVVFSFDGAMFRIRPGP